jgi:hypothetical protein
MLEGITGIADASTTTINFNASLQPPMRGVPTVTVAGTLNTSDNYSSNPSAASPSVTAYILNATGGRISVGGFSGLISGRWYAMLGNNFGVVRLSSEI